MTLDPLDDAGSSISGYPDDSPSLRLRKKIEHPPTDSSPCSKIGFNTGTDCNQPQPSSSQSSEDHNKPSSPKSESFKPPSESGGGCPSTGPLVGEKADVTDPEEPLCRICLSGRDDDDPALGRFIQPCLCRGTMAHIHVGCLQRWRTTSPSIKSFYRCDQCGYQYKLQRARIAGLAENKAILGGVTAVFFFVLVILAGYVAGWLLEGYSYQTAMVEDGWDHGLAQLPYDSTGKIVGEFVSQAVRVLNNKLHVDAESARAAAPLTHHKAKKAKLVTDVSSGSTLKLIPNDESAPHSYRYLKVKSPQSASSVDKGATTEDERRPSDHQTGQSQTKGSSSQLEQNKAEQPQEVTIMKYLSDSVFNKLESLIKLAVKGLAFIGVMSFFQLAISISLFSPWNFGVRNSVLRVMRTSNRTGARDPNGAGSVLILVVVILGLAKAIQGAWKLVKKVSQWGLRQIEDGVIDVRA